MSTAKRSSPHARKRRGEVKLEVFQQIRTEIRRMQSTLDMGALLWVICHGLGRLGLRFDFFGINLIDAQASPPSGTAHFRTPEGGWGQQSYPDLAGLPLWGIWKKQQVEYRRDLEAEDLYGERPTVGRRGIRCLVDIPFSHGTLAVSSTLPEAFAPGDLGLLQEMAALCSEGFGRLEDLRALERRAQEAEVLSAAIAVVAAAGGLEEVFQVVVREAARLTSAEWATLFLYDELAKVLVPRAQVGHQWEVYRQIRLQPGEDVSGQVLLSGEGMLCDDLSAAHQTLRPENRALLASSLSGAGGTGAVVPLKAGGRILGTLSVRSKHHRCSQRDLVLLERLAAQAALAIERTRHVHELSLNLALQRVRNETLRMEKEEDWTRLRIAFHEELSRLVDVPFLGGTLAMNSLVENAFGQQDIQVLQSFAPVMSEAHLRLRQIQRQEAVRQVREAVWQMQKSEDLLQVLTVTREQLLEAGMVFDDVGINVVDTSTQPWAVHYYYFFPNQEEKPGWTVWSSATDPAAQQIFQFWQAGKPVYRPHMQREDMLREGWNPENLTHPVAAVLDLPFSKGTLALNSRYPNAFSPEDIAFLEELAGAFSEGFRRLEGLTSLEQRAREAEALASAINAVYNYTSLHQRLEEIARQIRELIGARRCMLLLYDEGEGVLIPQAREGYGEEVLQRRIRPGEGLSGHVYTTGEVYFNQSLPDPQLEALSARNQVLLEQAIRGSNLGPSAGIPLKLGGQVLGVVVAGQVGRVLGERDLLLLERLAAQASLAIERSRHERELALNLALQRVRNQILEMQEAADWEQVLFSLHRELNSLVEFWFCSIQLIDQPAGRFTYYTTYHAPEDSHLQGQESLPLPLSLKQVLATGSSLYRRTRAELERFQDEVSLEVQCIVDVPFPGGTVAMNSIRENAFSDQDIAVLGRFAQVISEGYRRLQDLRQLAQARQRLQQAQKLDAVGQLTAGIAHNFNNLLQANLGNINLAMLSGSAEVQGFLQDADAAAMRGADLVRQLMLFSRAEAKETRFRPVDLGAVIANTVSLCRKTIDRRIEMPLELPADLPLVQADAGHLEQVLLNLYLNARDALEDKDVAPCIRTAARVVLEAGPGEGRYLVCVEVSDNGSGMDAPTRERIFEPFFTTKEVGKGTGLGLATVYGILQRHQGWIECQSKVGQGTTFSLYLPASAGVEPEGEAILAGEQPDPPLGTETLLIIDDEEMVRRSTIRLFSDLGYQVLEAEDGLRGLEVFDRHREAISLVLLDLSMPGLSGREVLRELKARVPRLKVVIFTGDAAVREEFAGRAGLVEKPFSLRQLARVVRQALDAA